MSIPVVTVGQSREDLVGGLERLHGPVTVVRRCGELAELLAACQSGLARAAVIANGTEELTASLVDRLAAVGVSVVALSDDPAEAVRLRSIGVVTASLEVDSASLASTISDSVGQLSGRARRRAEQRDSGYADTAAELRPSNVEEEAEQAPAGDGRVITVWGPTGAPGRTLVAVNMAAELAAEGKSVILVDADSYGASVAASLGLLDESAGLAQACRLADQGLLDVESLKRIAVPVFTEAGSFRVLTGITRADRWTELRAAALATVYEYAREIAEVVVVDAGFCVEADEELSFDSMAPRRNAATLRSIELADTVYAVGAADAIGVPRLVRGLAEVAQAVPQAAPLVVLNKVRAASAGRSPNRELREAWDRYGPGSAIEGFLPSDPEACDAALLSGAVLLESAPESALRQAIAKLVCAAVQQNGKSSVIYSRARRRLKR
ncbi:P-loop NTPase [Arthrobacter sp. AZCC_0090]|uniref:AAA family ATPase n=1 Tax=Arthrobacter sp. AZCC_0090 TaxID=2735881 RepID=UPI0016086D6D|nr:P-loop NTPase [Arthrobacter sp. AZCC_0090]MBB6403916.1 MinD-like ATPase involved in chromosome partitioning or flagellar assembly [Arthrobacter sp. AZCC_0090]